MRFKRIISTITASLLVLGLSSCLLKNHDLVCNKDLSYTFTEEDEQKIRSEMERFKNAIASSDSLDVVGSWNTINRDAYAISTYRTIEYVNYCMHGKNYKSNENDTNTAYEKYVHYNDLLNEIISFTEDVYQDIYDSKWKDEFFSGMTEEEIEELLNNKKPDRYYELEKSNEEILSEYHDILNSDNPYNLITTLNSDSFKSLYVSLVNNYQEEARLLNYENYREYAYKNVYSRDYSPSEVDDFYKYVKDYIVPLYKKYKDYSLDNNITYFDSLFKNNIGDANDDYISRYFDYFGGNMKKNFEHLIKDGYYFVGESDDGIDQAYTTYLYIESIDEPLMFFGKSYHDTMTFIHEFGHYNAYRHLGASSLSYDLAETHSQGNEMLYRAWVAKNFDLDQKTKESIKGDSVSSICNAIILSSIVDLFEKYVYEDDDLTKEELDLYYLNAISYFGDSKEILSLIYGDSSLIVPYWKLVCFDNPLYYISYAMSDIPTLEIYSLALTDLDNAKAKYEKTFKLDSAHQQDMFKDVLDYAGLYNPFEEEAYSIVISNL